MQFLSILKEYWGYGSFRGIQQDIIGSISQGKDTLGLMPTGGGKSITFQVPALVMPGTCIVITPLIALMKDQVDHLREKGIGAAAIYSGLSHQEIIKTLENCIFGGVKILYVSPERLQSDIFQAKLRHMKVSFITVDEAHCISQWGYDFRPSYLNIARLRDLIVQQRADLRTHLKDGVPPILALTATATPKVVDDIQDRLHFREHNVFRMSFERKNLSYIVRKTADKRSELVHILKSVPGSAIVYARSRKRTKEVADMLNQQLNPKVATYFHAGLDYAVKNQRQQDWQDDKTRIIVATNAFGMGIDKPDVRLVIHIDCPDSLEAYFQEAGRAGRDGKKAYAVLLFNDADRHKMMKRVNDNFPEKEFVKDIYDDLAYFYQVGVGSGNGYSFEFNIDKFCQAFRHFPIQVNAALHLLEQSGYLHYEDNPDLAAQVMFLLERNELYRLDHTTKLEETVITALLRKYTGVFTDYAYIDEAYLADVTGLSQQQVYSVLKSLHQQHILHFIPHRHIPFITYLQNREERSRIVIPHSVYEERKALFIKHLEAVEHYATTDNICRSRQLLAYFGEQRSSDCRQCDVCLDDYHGNELDNNQQKARKLILDFLADRKPHRLTELMALQLPTMHLNNALQYLIHEGEITLRDRTIQLNG